MPVQELPFVPYRCRYLERYYNRMVKEKDVAKKMADIILDGPNCPPKNSKCDTDKVPPEID